MKKTLFYIFLLTFLPFYAQVGIGTTTPDASAMLDIQSTNSGILIPRMTATERDNIASPATGLMVYVTDDNTFWYFDGANWLNVNSGQVDDEDWTVNGNDMYNNNSGNTGVGTTTPEYKLDVNGNLRHGNALFIYSNVSGGAHAWARFNSPDNGYGDNVFLGAGGTTLLGSGESSTTVRNNIDTTNGHEILYLTSDRGIDIKTHLQDGWDSRFDALSIQGNRDWYIDFKNIMMHDSIKGNHSYPLIKRSDYHYGYGIAICSGEGMTIGGGESANLIFNNVDLSQTEILYLSSDREDDDEAIKFITNTQQGWDNRIEPVTILGRGDVNIAYSNDAGPNGSSVPGGTLNIGNINGQHLELDDNEIHAMSDDSTPQTLYLNDGGGRVRFGELISLKPSATPSSPQEGDVYMDESTHKLRCYDGSAWHDLW